MRKSIEDEYKINVKKFKHLDIKKMELEPNEKIAHCIDKESFGGQYYYPQWVVTDHGRTWSMRHNKWMTPQPLKDSKNPYWGYSPKKNGKTTSVYVHLLVLNYFKDDSDNVALEFFGEDGVEGHHIYPLKIDKRFRCRGLRNEKIKQCMKDSSKKNLLYQEKTHDHTDDTLLSNGNITIDEKKGTSKWSDELKGTRSFMHGSGKLSGNSFGTFYKYSKDAEGNLVKNLNLKLGMKGSFKSENDVVIGKYKFNADENKELIMNHVDEILAKVEQDPPKLNYYNTKAVLIDNVFVYYAINE